MNIEQHRHLSKTNDNNETMLLYFIENYTAVCGFAIVEKKREEKFKRVSFGIDNELNTDQNVIEIVA